MPQCIKCGRRCNEDMCPACQKLDRRDQDNMRKLIEASSGRSGSSSGEGFFSGSASNTRPTASDVFSGSSGGEIGFFSKTGIFLFIVAGSWMLFHAVKQFSHPEQVSGFWLYVIGVEIAIIVVAFLLHKILGKIVIAGFIGIALWLGFSLFRSGVFDAHPVSAPTMAQQSSTPAAVPTSVQPSTDPSSQANADGTGDVNKTTSQLPDASKPSSPNAPDAATPTTPETPAPSSQQSTQ